jgi:hypothetical protein
VSLLCAACGTSSQAASGGGSNANGGPNTTEAPLPAGPTPSHIATMVCDAKAQREIAEVLGVKATVGDRRWVAHRYSCVYGYTNGSFNLSVKELSSWGQTLDYFHSLGREMGLARSLANLGQGAFQVTDGSVVVRKDWKVLLVDISPLPPRFGVPATSSGDVAVTVADVILGCWDGD